MLKRRVGIVTLLVALATASLGLAVFATTAPTGRSRPAQAVTVQNDVAGPQHLAAAGTGAEAAAEAGGESEQASAEDGPGGSQHDFQGQETGQH